MIDFIFQYAPFFIFGFCFSGFRELSEHGKEGAFEGFPDWWNTPKAHRNKHEWGDKYLPKWIPAKVRWWLFYSPLVFVTDAEHLFQLLSALAVIVTLYTTPGGLDYTLAFIIGANVFNLIKPIFNLK